VAIPLSPVGVVLAGGAGHRLGGAKATALLDGLPLISYALAALSGALADVAVVAKHDSPLPGDLGGAARWTEPDEPRHPVVGLIAALRAAGDRAIVAVAVDMPLLDAITIHALATVPAGRDGVAVVARAAGRAQPLLARYEPGALAGLEAADATAPLTATVESLAPAWLELPDAIVAFNVNTADDLAQASRLLAQRPARGS
jgi:molybdopterin-guanine dinucleotide biosynthesis protein A